MCQYVEGDYVTPGFGCCQCKTYNGLQRVVCKNCGRKPCSIVVPPHVLKCTRCGFALSKQDWAKKDVCPACVRGNPLKQT